MLNELQRLENITPEIEGYLNNIGITSVGTFMKLGGEKAYQLLTETGHGPDDELYFRLLGAELSADWRILAARDNQRAMSRFAETDEP